MSNDPTRRFAALVGFVLGGAVAGAAFWAIGYYGWVSPIRHPLKDLLAFVTLLVFPMSLVAPLALVRYLGRNLQGAKRWLVTLVGYGLLIGFTFVLAYLELFQALGVETAEEALAFFAALFGVTFGGIAGSKLATNVAGPGIRPEADATAGWEDGADGWREDDE
ncbi:hypothetical protein BRC81_06595 [Halobacteriales archaeon QS_1_68_20]|nr:MAG: hypothetical protein BRC81_06595 [Halobacteriales archaeon QS_1_68_20]